MKGAESTPRLKARLTASAEAAVRSGHPWVFAKSIREQNRLGQPGELAVLYDRKDRFLAVGLYDPESPIRVRVLEKGKPQALDDAWWRARFESTIKRREGLFDTQTTGFRWLNGESDGWPGLVLDNYDTNLVLKLYTAAWAPRLGEIIQVITERLEPGRLILRLSRNIQSEVSRLSDVHDGAVLAGPPLEGSVTFRESGLWFEADILRGQKTGFFLDQRENRRKVGGLASGRRLLNAFSFSGGFSVYAARGGAVAVTDLDISAHALESARRNFNLNAAERAVVSCNHETVKADAFEWLDSSPAKFDLIVLDPPSMARRETQRSRAIAAYARLARLGIQRLSAGGILVASSCSAHVTADEFFRATRTAAVKSRRRFKELETTRHAPDHPATFEAAQYLKTIYLSFSS